MEAIANDEEAAAQWLAHQPPEDDEPAAEPLRPRFSEWSPERAELAKVVDALRAVASAVIASAGATPERVKPELRPQSAVERLKQVRDVRRRANDRAALFADLWPGGIPGESPTNGPPPSASTPTP